MSVVLAMYLYWGVGLQQTRAEYQQPLGRAFVDAGADLVVGCHPPRDPADRAVPGRHHLPVDV